VDYAVLVSIVQCISKLPQDQQSAIQGQRFTSSEQFCQRASGQVFHSNIELTISFTLLVDLDNAWMIQLRRSQGFALEPANKFAIPCKMLGQHLESNNTVISNVSRFVHHCEATTANFFDDFVFSNAERWLVYSRLHCEHLEHLLQWSPKIGQL